MAAAGAATIKGDADAVAVTAAAGEAWDLHCVVNRAEPIHDHVATRRARVFYELSQHSVNSWGFVILEAREAPALCVLGHLGQFPLLHMCCVCVVHSEMLSSGAWHPASAPACL